MKIDKSLSSDYATLTLKGEFDTFYCPRFMEEIEALLDHGITHVILDMSQVRFINSTAIGAIIKAHKRCRAESGELVVSEPSPFVRKVMNALGIENLIQIFDADAARKHIVQLLNRAELGGDAPADEQKVLITFPDDTRNQQIANFTKGVATSSMTHARRSLVGRMRHVDDRTVRLVWSGERYGVTAGQGQQLFFPGGEINLKFQVKLCKKGYFQATAKVLEATGGDDDEVLITAGLEELPAADREALRQYAEDMEYLKQQLPGQ